MSAGDDDTESKFADRANGRETKHASKSVGKQDSIFSVPEPIKRLFDQFPLRVYSSNELPRRSPITNLKALNRLYVFSTTDEARSGRPSFNPVCLKWQAYLKFCRIDHALMPSSNHASPTGILPFLLPAASFDQPLPAPIPSSKLAKWIDGQQTTDSRSEQNDMRFTAYSSLVDHRIRAAWLYNLYLDPDNFSSVAKPLYIDSITSNSIVRRSITYQLRTAARDELLNWSRVVSEDELYIEAGRAFKALETLLSGNQYFFAVERPALFDASVFAYTHLLLDDDKMHWKNVRLKGELERYSGLVQHRNRCLEVFLHT